MKSDSDSAKPRNKWQLKKTLKRKVDYRPIENEDIKYVWAAYKKGALAPMGELFADGLMLAEEFKAEFQNAILTQCHAAWIISATTKRGLIPVGLVLAAYPMPNAPYMIVNGMCWFPWATKRNVIEGIVGFLDRVRREFPLKFYALPEHKRTYEVCAMHSIVRRVGTSYIAFPGHAAAEFETRT